jgi:hypothetical protein
MKITRATSRLASKTMARLALLPTGSFAICGTTSSASSGEIRDT